jgi:hypothetical protein
LCHAILTRLFAHTTQTGKTADFGYGRGWSNAYYMPAHYMSNFSEQMKLFAQHHLFVELAVPTAIGHLVDHPQYDNAGICQFPSDETKVDDWQWSTSCKIGYSFTLNSPKVQEKAVKLATDYCPSHHNTALLPHVYP